MKMKIKIYKNKKDSRGASADYAKERLIKKANSSNRPFLTLLLVGI